MRQYIIYRKFDNGTVDTLYIRARNRALAMEIARASYSSLIPHTLSFTKDSD